MGYEDLDRKTQKAVERFAKSLEVSVEDVVEAYNVYEEVAKRVETGEWHKEGELINQITESFSNRGELKDGVKGLAYFKVGRMVGIMAIAPLMNLLRRGGNRDV